MRAETPRLRPPRWPSGLVPWTQAVQAFLEKLSQAAKVQIEIQGATRSESGAEITLDLSTNSRGTASGETSTQDAPRWPRALVPWKKTVQSHTEKLAAAAGVQIEIFGTTRAQSGTEPTLEIAPPTNTSSTRSTVSKQAATAPRWPTSHAAWCRALQDFIERIASALQTRLELAGAARSSGGGKLVFALKTQTAPQSITLRLDIQSQEAYVFYCAGVLDDDGDPYTAVSTVEHWTNGDITYTTTQPDPGPHTSTPTVPPHDCNSAINTDDRDPLFNYGSLVSTDAPTYTDALNANLRTLALAALEIIGDPTPGVAFAITASASTDIIQAVAHGLDNDDRVIFPRLIGGLGLTAGTSPYYVRDKTPDTFKVATTIGGAAVDITTPITAGTCRKEVADLTAVTRTWLDNATPPTDIAHNLGQWDSGFSISAKLGFNALSKRYRWTNDSALDLVITWTQGGTTHTLTVPADESSAWYSDTLPTAPSTFDAISSVTVALA